MTTTHKIDKFLLELFTLYKLSDNDLDILKAKIAKYYTIGTQGINPSKNNTYKVNSIPGKEFSGYNLLAYYYVSWALAMPELLGELGLHYEKEYAMAEKLFNEK